MSRIRGLDGLRAISILLVLFGHVAGTRGAYSLDFYRHFGDLANLGVRVFFIISGYLITTLLLREESKTGTISLPKFYFRRTMRIFPAFYVFLVIMAVAQALHLIQFMKGDLIHGFTYTTNFHYARSWWIGHIWSLSVEEQFYLLWPATMLLLGSRRGLRTAILVVLASPFIRLAISHFFPAQRDGIGESFPTISDTIALGCILAGYWDEINAHPWFRGLIRSRWFFTVPVVIVLLNLKAPGRLRWAVLETAINVLIAICIARAVALSEGRTARLLNWRPLVFIGQMSYSLYLWQQPFLNRIWPSWLTAFPLNLCLAAMVALLSYYLVERPFLALREKVESRRVAATQPLAPAPET